jgi:hypothetical protein
MEFSSEGVLCVESDTILDMLGIQVAVDCPLVLTWAMFLVALIKSLLIEELDKVLKAFD